MSCLTRPCFPSNHFISTSALSFCFHLRCLIRNKGEFVDDLHMSSVPTNHASSPACIVPQGSSRRIMQIGEDTTQNSGHNTTNSFLENDNNVGHEVDCPVQSSSGSSARSASSRPSRSSASTPATDTTMAQQRTMHELRAPHAHSCLLSGPWRDFIHRYYPLHMQMATLQPTRSSAISPSDSRESDDTKYYAHVSDSVTGSVVVPPSVVPHVQDSTGPITCAS
jgi:hypothetical protein